MNLQKYLMIKQSDLYDKARRQANNYINYDNGDWNIITNTRRAGRAVGATPAQIDVATDQVLNRHFPDQYGTSGPRASSPTPQEALNDVMGGNTRLSSGALGRVLSNPKLLREATRRYPETFDRFIRLR